MEEKFIKVIEKFKEKTKKDCYKIDLVEGEASILDNKIGGKAYLPVGEEYPKDDEGNNLALLLQVDLSEIDLEGYPKKGILEIFTDAVLDYPCQYEVKYFDKGLEYQTDIPEINLENYIVGEPHKINLSKSISYMSMNDYRFAETICEIVNEVYGTNLSNYSELDDYFEGFDWYDRLSESYDNDCITIGGYPDFTQDDPRYNMEENKDECLFKLDSCFDFDTFYIGDAGILFTLISKEDIQNCNFQNAVVDWDCC